MSCLVLLIPSAEPQPTAGLYWRRTEKINKRGQNTGLPSWQELGLGGFGTKGGVP